MGVVLPEFTAKYHHDPYPAISPLRPELSTAGKVVVITGGAGGIGSAMARAFVQSGTRDLVLLDLNEAGLLKVKSTLEAESRETTIHPIVVDITDTAAVRTAFEEIRTTVGRPLDILVNNAGFQNVNRPVLEIDMNEWFKCFEINVKGSFNVAVEFLRHARLETAVLVNVSSILAHYGVRRGYATGHSGYSASKTAITKALDIIQEEVPSVRIINIHPGMIPTAMAAKIGNIANSLDSVELAAHFAVWLTSAEAEFLKGRLVWSNWDVEEMMARKDEILQKDLLRLELAGIGE